MTERTLDCAKCGDAMVTGFVADFTHAREQSTAPTWIEGTPEPSLLRGVKLKGKQSHAVQTYRCAACGYLESYARGH